MGSLRSTESPSSRGWRPTPIVGGTGELARVLRDRHSDWNACVLDLPEVIERAVEHPRLVATGDDAFVEVPESYDVYLFVNVLHDWEDEACVRLLANAAAAGSANSAKTE